VFPVVRLGRGYDGLQFGEPGVQRAHRAAQVGHQGRVADARGFGGPPPHLVRVRHLRNRIWPNERHCFYPPYPSPGQAVQQRDLRVQRHRVLVLEPVARAYFTQRDSFRQLHAFSVRLHSAGHAGGRFSANAAIPSRRSADIAAVRHAASSMSSWAARPAPQPLRIARLAALTATGEFPATTCASSSAVSRTLLAGPAVPAGPPLTRRSTRPSRQASSMATCRPVSTRSAARPVPSRRSSNWVPPPPGTSPTVTSVSPNTAVSSATIRSQDSASSQPPPSANPCTAATTGCGSPGTAPKTPRITGRCARISASLIPARSFRSAPAQNARLPGAPLTTTARTDGSAASSPHSSVSERASPVLIAFTGGRSSMISATTAASEPVTACRVTVTPSIGRAYPGCRGGSGLVSLLALQSLLLVFDQPEQR